MKYEARPGSHWYTICYYVCFNFYDWLILFRPANSGHLNKRFRILCFLLHKQGMWEINMLLEIVTGANCSVYINKRVASVL